jgi:LysR family transcriptional regulator, transcriptional activator for dmlA
MDSTLLRAFIAVAEGGSIAAGARAESISASLASRRIAALETSLDVKLLQRTTRKLQITDAGRTVLAWAKEALQQYASLVDELGAQQKRPIGVLRVACNEYTATRYLAQAIAPFRKTHPGVQFVVTLADEPIKLIDSGYDLVIHAGRLPDSNLVGRRIRSYRRILCASPAYLDRYGTPKTPEDLTRHACLTHARTEPRNWFFRSIDGDSIVAQAVPSAVQTNAYLMLIDLALADSGILRISGAMVSSHLESGALVRVLSDYTCVDPAGDDPGFWLIQPDRRLPYRVKLFANHLIRHLREAP